MGYGSYIKNNAVHEWSDFYVKYSKLNRKIGTKDFNESFISEIEKVERFYKLLENKAQDEKLKLLKEIKGDIKDEWYQEMINIKSSELANNSCQNIEKTQKIQNTDITHKHTNLDFSTNNTSIEVHESDEEYLLEEEKYVSSINDTENDNQLGVMRFITMPETFLRRKKEKHITEFLHSLIKIKGYRDINVAAFSRLIKRNKTIQHDNDKIKILKQTYFYNSVVITQLKKVIKKIYKGMFAQNNPKKARSIYRRIKRGELTNDIFYLIAGFFIGINVILTLYMDIDKRFFAINNLFLGFILFGLCVKIFKINKINYKFIFNFDYSSTLNNIRYLVTISGFEMCYILISKFVKWQYKYIFCLGIMILLFIMPIHWLYNDSRFYLISAFGRGLIYPTSTIRFRHFYFVDVLQSFSWSFKTIMVMCKCTNKEIQTGFILLFPGIRILQCLKRYSMSRLLFPHIFNCVKYSITIFTVLFKLYISYIESNTNVNKLIKNLGIFIMILNSLTSLTWDIFVDFSIFRSRFMFPIGVYLSFIGYDIICRFLWIGEIIKSLDNNITFEIVTSIMEIIRRFIWTLIRVEVEHLNNCNELKLNKALKLTSGELFYKKDDTPENPIDTDTDIKEQSESIDAYEGFDTTTVEGE